MTTTTRNGGDLVVETLTALGAETIFGLPGQHALGLFDALSRGPLRLVAFRTENNAAFAADGYARATGRPGVVFVSTGRGALTALAGLHEAYMTDAFGVATATELARPDFGALAGAFGIPVEVTGSAGLAGALARAWAAEGPNVVVLPTHLSMFAPPTWADARPPGGAPRDDYSARVIIWSRWGFLSFLAFGLGVVAALGVISLFGGSTEGALTGALVFLFAGIFNLVLALVVYPRLDKPKPVTYTVKLPQPIKHANGQVQTHAVQPALDTDGQQLWSQSHSSLFFIPARILWVPLLAVALILAIVGLVSR